MGENRKRIGFVDLNLENFHANVYLKLFRAELKHMGYTIAGGTGLMAKESREWAEKNQVRYFRSVEEMDAEVDHFIVLAPSNPEVHLELCSRVFPLGKSTYVDKTFAPDLPTARRLFSLADRHGVAMQTTSALRYTNVQEGLGAEVQSKVQHMIAWGGGSSFGEYAIHPLEMIVSCMGPGATRMMVRGEGDRRQLLLQFSGDRTAVVNVYTRSRTPYAAVVTTAEETRHFTVDAGRIFLNTARAVIDLFESGRPGIPRDETLAIRRIMDLAGQARVLKGFVKV